MGVGGHYSKLEIYPGLPWTRNSKLFLRPLLSKGVPPKGN